MCLTNSFKISLILPQYRFMAAPIILGIESSCDDTSAAVLSGNALLSNVVAGQEVHKLYGGVVPELASRAHQENIVPVVDKAIKDAGIDKSDINGIAVTVGPGLLGPLLVGTCFAKAMAAGLEIPIIPVNHMQAHVLAHFIEEPSPSFPFLCLTVSGGHTQIVRVDSALEMRVLGETTDDAAGEAFDKTAKLLGLPYPGGPLIDKHAKNGDPLRFSFPEPRVPGLNFSFSGLKTAILYFVRDMKKQDEDFVEKNLDDICASVQHRITTILMNKFVKAAEQEGIQTLTIAGGVSANSGLRKLFAETCAEKGWESFIPDFQYCTDNGAMIAMAGRFLYDKQRFGDDSTVPMPRFAL